MSWLLLNPMDTLVVRDGRPFDAGADVIGHSIFPPFPSTTSGALGAALGHNPDRVVGPLLVRGDHAWDPRSFEIVAPAPLDLGRVSAGVLQRASVAGPAGWRTDADAVVPRSFEPEGESASGWLDAQTLARYLSTPAGATLAGDTQPMSDIRLGERRVGIARRNREVVEGMFYSSEHLRLRPTIRLACRVEGGGELPKPVTVRLGGESRIATVEKAPHEPSLPQQPVATTRLSVLLLTPAIFSGGWRPQTPEGGRLVAAACRPVPVSTWSGQGGFLTQRGSAAGSVYLYEFDRVEDADRFATKWHGSCLPQATKRLRTAGFGACLIGVW